MVRLKIAYWEFDFEAVCPTLDHNLLSQAHIYVYYIIYRSVLSADVAFVTTPPCWSVGSIRCGHHILYILYGRVVQLLECRASVE